MARGGGRRAAVTDVVRGLVVALSSAFKRHNVLTYASAVAFQVLIALVALVLFGLALLPELGVTRIWFDHLQPFVQSRLSLQTYLAVNSTVEKIFSNESKGLLVFALALSIWEISGAV